MLDSDYQAPASGNIDESLFAIEADEARMPAGEAVPVLLQVVDPAPDSTVTVTLSDGAVFTDSEMAADDGSTYTRTFASGEQASAWMLYVRADGDFTAEATYIARTRWQQTEQPVNPSPAQSRSRGIIRFRCSPPFRREPVNTSTTSPT